MSHTYESEANWSPELRLELGMPSNATASGFMAYHRDHWYVPASADNKVFSVSKDGKYVMDINFNEEGATASNGPVCCLVYDDYLYVSCWKNNKIYRRKLCYPMEDNFELFATLAFNTAFMIVHDGKMYVATLGAQIIYMIDMHSTTPHIINIGDIVVFASVSSITGTPDDFVLERLAQIAIENDNLYVVDSYSGDIFKIPLDTGTAEKYAQVLGGFGCVARDGYLYVSSASAGTITKIPLCGTVPSMLPTLDISTSLNNPFGMVLRHDVIYVFNAGDNSVTKIYLNKLAEIVSEYGSLIKTTGIVSVLSFMLGFYYKKMYSRMRRNKRVIERCMN